MIKLCPVWQSIPQSDGRCFRCMKPISELAVNTLRWLHFWGLWARKSAINLPWFWLWRLISSSNVIPGLMIQGAAETVQPPRSVTVPVSCLGPNGHCLSLLTPGVTATAAFYIEPVSKPTEAFLQRAIYVVTWSIVTPSLVDPNPVFFALISSQPSGRLYLSLLKYYKPNVWSMGWAASDKTECSNDPLCWVNNFWCAQFTIEN